jgi:hypothetical protein
VLLALLALALPAVLSGCATETRIIRKKPWFAGLPGVEGDATVIEPTREATYLELPEDQIRADNDDGTVTLRARNGRHLMIHIYNGIMEGDRDLFTQQILSNRTKQEFLSRGKDPGEAFDMLVAMEDDIVDLFNAMPFAERTPGLFLTNVGDKVQRVRVSNLQAQYMKLAGMDMIMERGEYRLVWFVPTGNK